MGHACSIKATARSGVAAILIAAGLALATAQAQPHGDIGVRVAGPDQGALAPIRALQLHGTWPDSCTPRVDHAVLDDAELVIHMRTSAGPCTPRPTAWQQQFQPHGSHGPQLPRQVYRVFIHMDDVPEVVAFQLLDLSDADAAVIPENGFWWSVDDPAGGPALAGTGVGIERQGDRVAASLLGFNERGEATWYFGSGQLHGRSVQLELVALDGGDDGFSLPGSRPRVQPGPRLAIEFSGPAQASAWLTQPAAAPGDLRLRQLRLSRAAFDQTPPGAAWQGRWVLVATAENAPAGHAQRFDLRQLSTLADDHFVLRDDADHAALECRTASSSDGQPALCTLSLGHAAVAELDQIGIDRMSGYLMDGNPVTLLRVPQ